MNMGASGIAPSFAAAYGANIIKRKKATLLFGIFVIIGAVVLGRNVSVTLGKNLLPKEFLTPDTALVILIAATLSLFMANVLKIPQSTSQVAVGAVIGAGLYFKHIYFKTLLFKILPMWIILPGLAYFITYYLYKLVYPPHKNNLRLYEKIFANEKKLKISAVIVSCYVAFAIGANNVANAVGPLFGAGLVGIMPALIALSPFFGVGAWLMGKGNLFSAGKEIIPLGIFSSALVSFVTATLLIIASLMGVPQSLVQLNILSVFAVSSLKDGRRATLERAVTKKTLIIWTVTPILSMIIAYGMLFLFLPKG